VVVFKMSKSIVLRILDEELDRLHKDIKESTESTVLLMNAHCIGYLQKIYKRIEEEV
jgi:hypothetical protein